MNLHMNHWHYVALGAIVMHVIDLQANASLREANRALNANAASIARLMTVTANSYNMTSNRLRKELARSGLPPVGADWSQIVQGVK